MSLSPLAGKPAPPELLIDVGRLVNEYHARCPDVGDPQQLVSFGTSGHRGTAQDGTFTEAHIVAITQAICEYRAAHGVTGSKAEPVRPYRPAAATAQMAPQSATRRDTGILAAGFVAAGLTMQYIASPLAPVLRPRYPCRSVRGLWV